MAMSQDLHFDVNRAGAGAEADPGEKPAIDFIEMGTNKLKYLNNKYEKVNAKMYDYKCDVKLTVGKQVFKGHKKVLADASDYFNAMFSHEMKEKEEFLIELKEISPDGFGAMLDYFYHGHVTIEPKIVPDILEAARFFHVEWILDVTCDFMIRNVAITNFPLVMDLADKFSLGDLRWEIFKYFGTNLPMLVQKEDFYSELCEELLMQFLMEGIYVDIMEFNLMELVINWVKADKENRQAQMLPLLRQVRFHTMELEELEDVPAEVLEFKEIKDEIQDAKDYCLNVAQQCLKTEEKYLARGSRPTVMVSTFNDFEESNVVVYKDPFDDQSNLFVEQLGPSGFAAQYSSTNQAQIGNFLFAAGGFNFDYTNSGRVFRYNPKDREWTEMATMNLARVSFGMCASKDRLYVVGGVCNTSNGTEIEENILQSAEKYNPEENEWKSLPDLPHGIFDLAAAYCNNVLYVSGGLSADPTHMIPLKFVYCLAEGAKEWSTAPPMQEPRQGHSMTPINNKLYVIGGMNAKDGGVAVRDSMINEVYDLETKQWTFLAQTPEICGHLYRHVGLLDNKIFFLCNSDSEVYLSHYDVEKDEFKQPCLQVGQGVHKVAVLQIAYPITS